MASLNGTKRVVVAIESNYEAVTRAGWEYRRAAVHEYFENAGFDLIRLEGKLARRYIAQGRVLEGDVVYLTGVGHGLEDVYTGDQHEPIFQIGKYLPQEARGKIVHFLSCQTGRKLGPDFIVNQCRAYFGYDVNFTFLWDYAHTFFECDSEIDRAFADGLSADQVYERAYELYSRRIDELSEAGKEYAASMLETDRDHLVAPKLAPLWGDPSARL